MLPSLLLLPSLIGAVLGAPWQSYLSKQSPATCQYADESFVEDYNDAIPDNCACIYDERNMVCSIKGPTTINILDADHPRTPMPGQFFSVRRDHNTDKMKSVVTFHPFTGESICQLAIEFPAMPEAQYARGDTVMQVWVVDHMENPTWNNQPRKRMRLDTTTFPTWQVEQGWTQRFATLECKETMSFMVELSSTRDGDVAFWNKLMGKQGAPPIGWRMLHGC